MAALSTALALVALAALPATGQAADYTVTKTADTDDGTCSPGDCSLREAIEDAGSGDTVVVPAGTYGGAMLAANAVFSPNDGTTIAGAGAGQTVIDGNGLDSTFSIYDQTTLRGLTVTGGKAVGGGSHGGGLHVRQGGFLTLIDSVVRGNSAAGGGGGVYVDTQSRASLSGVLVSQNSTTSSGAGIRVEPAGGGTGTLAMTNVTISGNAATGTGSGAGLANEGATTGTNVTISGNVAAGAGGGVLNDPGTLALTNSTLAGNAAATGGAGIQNDAAAANLTLRNSIVTDGCAGSATPPVSSQGNNLDSGASCGFAAPADVASADPLLGPLAANGGNGLLTHALGAGSPAVDAASNAACPATDARGIARPFGAICDIGAYERDVAEAASNLFSFGKLKRNKKKGTAKLTVEVPGPGELLLAPTKRLRGADATAATAGEVVLKVAGRAKTRKRLRTKGKAKLRLNVTFTPTGGTALTKSKRAKLILRR